MFFCQFGNSCVVILVYVDDIIVTGSSMLAVDDVVRLLQTKFPTRDLSDLHYFLGLEASRSAIGLYLNQAKYISDLLRQPRWMLLTHDFRFSFVHVCG